MKKWLMGAIAVTLSTSAVAQTDRTLQLENVFDLEYAASPTLHPSGNYGVFVRQSMDIKHDQKTGRLWTVKPNGDIRPLTGDSAHEWSPVWSPDGKRLAFISDASGSPQITIYWTDTGKHAVISELTQTPSSLSWSPNGEYIAFSQFTPIKSAAPVSLPGKPEGADWTAPPQFVDKDNYRYDGGGYVSDGYQQIYVLSAEGGTARQITDDEYNNGGALEWSADGKQIYFSANRRSDAFRQPMNSEIYAVQVDTGEVRALTDRNGPDGAPKRSPNGDWLAFTGNDDNGMSSQISRLYVMSVDGAQSRVLTSDLDRSVTGFAWDTDGEGIYFTYDDKGVGQLARTDLDGDYQQLTDRVGGLSYGRPYGGGDFSVAGDDQVLYTLSNPLRPADLAWWDDGDSQQVTQLNEDALGHKQLAQVEEITYKSSVDGRDLQGWIAYPPNFDKDKDYPLILEIHGGPHTNYGPRFSAEVQLYAAAGYVVLYTNPRGSTSYGDDFANEIHQNYPSHDYDDLMDGVDAVIDKGFIDEDQLYVTGGSGGGVLTAWIVGHTDRFRAAVVAKPVINWYSFVLTADMYNYFYQYWFPGLPWENLEHYMKHSPISYVGNVTTPTMLLTGEQDYRTPMSETEQYYQALKLAGVETAMVRIQNSGHSIYARPSNLMSKVAYILYWFEKHKSDD